jgi:hypothetical protein
VKNAFALLTLGLMVVGSVACSNAPKKEAPKAQDSVSSTSEKAPETSKDLSLGASSSGLGH